MTALPPLQLSDIESEGACSSLDLQVDEASLKQFFHKSEEIKVVIKGAKRSIRVHVEQVTKSDDTKPDCSVLFLHGNSFTSQNWLDIKTVYCVASWGWRAVAIDLPGYGQSKDKLDDKYNSEFLVSLIASLDLKSPVIVSPSMSGIFSLPFLFGDGVKSLDRAKAFIPIAPILTGAFVKNYKISEIPTLIVSGSRDMAIGATSNKDLGHLSRGQYASIENAGHACYMHDPDTFHKYLYHFLHRL